MGYVHEFTCDKCGKQERNVTGDCSFSRVSTLQTWALLCSECKSGYDDLVEASTVALGTTINSFLARVTQEATP